MSSEEITPNPSEINPDEWARRHEIVRRRFKAFDELPPEAKQAYASVYSKWIDAKALDPIVALAQLRLALVEAWGHKE